MTQIRTLTCILLFSHKYLLFKLHSTATTTLTGATPGAVLKAGWLSKRGFKTQSMWRKRWVVLTTDALNYYHTEKDTGECVCCVVLFV